MKNRENPFFYVSELINLMIILGYSISGKGICYGYCYAAIPAMLLNEDKHFNDRSLALGPIYKQVTANLREKILAIYGQNPPISLGQEVQEYDLGEKLRELINREKQQRDQTIYQKLTVLNQQLKNEFATHTIKLIINQQRGDIASQAYFDTMVSYHYLSNLFTLNKHFSKQMDTDTQNAKLIIELLKPVNLEKKGLSIFPGDIMTGIFDLETLSKALSLLGHQLLQCESTVAFELSGHCLILSRRYGEHTYGKHTIAVGFDPKQKEWLIADSLIQQIIRIPANQEDKIALEILKEFSNKKEYLPGTVRPFYVNLLASSFNQRDHVNSIVHRIRTSTEWAALQVPCQDLNHQTYLINNVLEKASAKDMTFFFGQLPYSSLIKTMTIENYPLLYSVLRSRHDDMDIREIFDALIQCGADINQPDHSGWTPIYHYLVYCFREPLTDTHQHCLSLLLDKGADINTVTSSGNTALSQAVYSNKAELLIFLLEHGANPNQLITVNNCFTSSVFFYLVDQIGKGGKIREEGMILARILLKHGANPHVGENMPNGRSVHQELQAQYDKYQFFDGFVELLDLFKEYDRERGSERKNKI